MILVDYLKFFNILKILLRYIDISKAMLKKYAYYKSIYRWLDVSKNIYLF